MANVQTETRERRDLERERRRAEIVQAAEHVFATRGFDGATMEEVAEAVRIAKGTIYLYFPSKLDLFRAVIEAGNAAFLAALQEAATDYTNQLTYVCTPIF